MSQADNTANPYLITTEPFYQPNSNEVTLYEAAYQAKPVMPCTRGSLKFMSGKMQVCAL